MGGPAAGVSSIHSTHRRPDNAILHALRAVRQAPLEHDPLSQGCRRVGETHLDGAEPHAGKDWTDSGRNRDKREQLKQRAVGEGRTVPCPPDLTRLLHEHIRAFGVATDGRLFVGERNQEELPKGTILRYWAGAREDVFSPEILASPLAAVPYDLRHAGVSMMLWAGVPAARVAQIAGHSLEVLLGIYAKVLDGEEDSVRGRIEAGLSAS